MNRFKYSPNHNLSRWDFLGGPVVDSALPLQGCGFDPWLENIPHAALCGQKIKKKKKKKNSAGFFVEIEKVI